MWPAYDLNVIHVYKVIYFMVGGYLITMVSIIEHGEQWRQS